MPSCSSYLRVSAVHFYLSDCQDASATRKCQKKFGMSIARIAPAQHLYVIQILHPLGYPVTSPQNGHTVHSSHATPITTRLWTPTLTANKASRRKRLVLLRFCLSESQHFLAHNSQKRRTTDRYSSCNEVLVANSRRCTYNRTASVMAKVKWRC